MSLFALRNHVNGCFQTQSFNCFQTSHLTIVFNLLSKQLLWGAVCVP